MTDNEIIKALECYIKENEFEYFHSNTMNEYPLIRKALDLINRQKAEIERLKDLNKCYYTSCQQIAKSNHEIKTEAVKEFAEELKEKAHRCDLSTDEHEYYSVGVFEIDNLVKEMVGED